MPAGYLHDLIAANAAREAGVAVEDEAAYRMGAQGPDPLFLIGMFPLRLSSKPSKLGNAVHERRTGAFLRAMARHAQTPITRAYLMGFLTHYALDSAIHPYVYAQSRKEGRYSSSRHMALEKRWDALIHRAQKGRGTPLNMPGMEEGRAHWAEIAALWEAVLREVFPEDAVPASVILAAFSDATRVNRLTHSPRGGKFAAIWLLERLIGKPNLGTAHITPRFPRRFDFDAHEAWESPFEPGRAREKSVRELIGAGARRATELLSASDAYFSGALSEEDFASAIGDVGYDSGMQSKP